MMMMDFNNVLDIREKLNGKVVTSRDTTSLRGFIRSTGLIDLEAGVFFYVE